MAIPAKTRTLPLLQKHIGKFSRCVSCPLGKNTKYKVFYRGTIPCDILFLGEAPGEDELVFGEPFVGPAGKLLDELIESSLLQKHKIAFANAIVCSPQDSPSAKLRTPKKSEISACSTRLKQFLRIASPARIVAVGNTAEKSLKTLGLYENPNPKVAPVSDKPAPYHLHTTAYTKILHPSAILRQEEQGDLDYARTFHTLTMIRSSFRRDQ